jgi:hypothetical protein
MANTTIKITQLQNIGNGLATNTLLPVVNTSGTAITQKVTVGNVANFIMNQAGNTLAPAFLANLAYSVVNAAQPNITSVGTLNVNTLKISGGTNGYVLQTDGTGNLSWTTQSGGGGNGTPGGSNAQIQYNLNGEFAGDPDLVWDAGTGRLLTSAIEPGAIYTDEYYYANGEPFSSGNGVPSGSNTQIQFNDAGAFGGNTGFTFNKTTGIFTSPFLAGNGNGLANIQGANVSGAVSYASTANAVAAANVSGLASYTGNVGANIVTANKISSGELYSFSGVIVENADLTHGATAALQLPNNANSSSPIQITNSYGNIRLTTGITAGSLKNWTFDQNGVLYFPGGTIAADDIEGTNNFGFEMPANVGFGILTDAGNNEWSFGSNGTLSVPGINSAAIEGADGFNLRFRAIGEDASAKLEYYDGNSTTSAVAVGINSVSVYTGGNTWTFDQNGNLTLPGNTFAVNYANGQQVNISGGSGNTGNVTFDNQIVIGTGDEFGGGGLYLAPGPAEIANGQYLQVRGGDQPSHIHFDTGNNNFYDQYFGNDNKYVKLSAGADGNILIGTDDTTGNLYRWTFDSAGDTTVPGDIKTITTGFSFTSNISDVDTTTVANAVIVTFVTSSLFPAPVTGQVTISSVVGTTETNGTWYFEAVEANQIQLYYDEALQYPVDGTGWPAYVSGGLAVAAGYNNLSITGGNVSIINNNGNVWTFDNAGQINIPEGSGSFSLGRIQSANGYPTLLGYGSGSHGGPELDWMNSNDPANGFQDNTVLRNTLYINDEGFYVGFNENEVANTAIVNWKFNPDGSTIFPTLTVDLHNGGTQNAQTLQFGDNTQQAIITGPTPSADVNAQRLIIQGQRGNGQNSEGGDVYFWAGDADTYGGDIKIYAGDADNVSAGYGGYINIQGGKGFNEGGYVNITGGQSTNSVGAYVGLTGGQGSTTGGEIDINGGYGGGNGGNVNIIGGVAGNGLGGYGNVNISAGASTWTFDNTGSFVFPGAGVTMDGQTNALLTSGLANVTIGTFVQGADGGVSWEYQGDGSGNSSYGAVGLDTGGTANTANLRFKVQLVSDQGNVSTNKEWLFDTAGNLTLPTISTGSGTDEQTVIQSQRKIIPPFRYSAVIDGTTPTVVYTASSVNITSMKVTMQIQHTGLGMEFFEVYATYTGPDTFYTVSNRVAPPTIDDSGVVVDLNGSNQMQITVEINSGAATSWVTYDSTEFGIPQD